MKKKNREKKKEQELESLGAEKKRGLKKKKASGRARGEESWEKSEERI